MAKLEYKAECLCGGELRALFRKPTRFQSSIVRTHCRGCASEYQFTCDIEYNDKGRVYDTSHVVLDHSEKLLNKIKEKQSEAKVETK